MKKQTSPQRPDAKTLRNFMLGKGLAARMIAKAIEISEEGSDRAYLEARYRGRDVPQDVFVRPFFASLLANPEMLDGFMAALANTLVTAGSGNDCPEKMSSLLWDDIAGHVDTKYCADEVAPPAEPRALDLILDKLDKHLNAARAKTLPADCLEPLEAAVAASALARLSVRMADAESALQQVRRHVFEARTTSPMLEDKHAVARGELMEANRLLNKALGGVMVEDRGDAPRSALVALVDRLDYYLEATEHVGEGEPDAVHDLMHRGGVWAMFYDARYAEERGDEPEAVRLIPELREKIATAFAMCDELDARWALFKVSLDLIDEFRPKRSGAPASPRVRPATLAAGPAILRRQLAAEIG